MQIKNKDAFQKGDALIGSILNKMPNLSKPKREFVFHIFILFMGLRGRFNFMNMSRYGSYGEQTYRNQFEKGFDFLQFNAELINESCSEQLVIAFDPSYIPKSGKHTPGLGKFYSGCAQRALKGLEIGVLAAVDIAQNTAMSLEAIPTPPKKTLKKQDKSLVDHYAKVIIDRASKLMSISNILVVDGYFAKKKFIHPVTSETGFDVVCKLRKDANLSYIYNGPKTNAKGRPKQFDGKIALDNLDKRRIKLCHSEERLRIYSGIVYSKGLKTKIKIVYLDQIKNGKSTGKFAILFSTNLDMKGYDIFNYYKSRFQIEFLIRDSKQHTGLTHCQARSENKLHFHYNTSLTSVSIAKANAISGGKQLQRRRFSMANVKTQYLNKLITDRLFANLEIDLSLQKNKYLYRKLIDYGKIAA